MLKKHISCIGFLALLATCLGSPAQAEFTKVYQFTNQTGVAQASVKATTQGLESIIAKTATPSGLVGNTGTALISGVWNTTLTYSGVSMAAGTSVTVSWQTADNSCRLRDLRWGSGTVIVPTQLGGVPGGGMMYYDWPNPGDLTVIITNDTDSTLGLTSIEWVECAQPQDVEELASVTEEGLTELAVAAIDLDIEVLRSEVVYQGSLHKLPAPSVKSLTGKLDKAVNYKHKGLAAYLSGDLTTALELWRQAAKSIETFISEVTCSSPKGNVPRDLYIRWVVDGGGEITTAPEIRDALLALPEGQSLERVAPPPSITLPPCARLDPAGYRPWPVAVLLPGEYTALVAKHLGPNAGFIMRGSVLDSNGNVCLNWVEQAVAQQCVFDPDPPENGPIVIDGGAAYTNSLSVTLDLHAEDISGVLAYEVTDASGVWLGMVDPTETDFSIQVPGTLLPGDGLKTVSVRYCDLPNNWSDPYVATITLDQTPPVITASATNAEDGSPYTAGSWTNQDVIVHFECSDATSGVASSTADVTVSAEGVMPLVSGAATDNAGNSAGADFGPIYIDKTPPTISGSRTPDANENGWNNTDVTVSFTASDDRSGIASVTPETVLTADGAGQSVIGTAVDNAGNSATATVGDINIDKTPPTISGSRTPDANESGWNNTDVTVSFSASDEGSGIDSVTPDTVLSADGAEQSVTGTATDKAGNSADATVEGINIDKTAPSISGYRTPDANENGWNNTDVTVSFSASDEGSGIDSVTPETVLTEDGVEQFVTGTAVDKAGNGASVTVEDINIDKTAPTISGSRTPGANDNGWNNTDVTVSFSASDEGAGIDSVTPDTVVSTEGAGQSVTGTALDEAGNSASAIVGDINIDKTPPVVTIVLPGTGQYRLNEPGLEAIWSATDALSGVAPPSSGAIPIDTSVEGQGLLLIAPAGTAIDLAGNISVEVVVEYSCTGFRYGFLGLLSPYAAPPTSFNRGSDIPLKWQYTNARGSAVDSSAAAPSISVSPIGEPSGPGSRDLAYSAGSLTWQFNWKTDRLPAGVYVILITSAQTGQTNGPFYITLR